MISRGGEGKNLEIQVRARDVNREKGQKQMAHHITRVVSTVTDHRKQHILYIHAVWWLLLDLRWPKGSVR